MRGPGEILLLSTYELGHPPQGVAMPAALLERAGFRPAALDLAVEPFDRERVRRARLVAISVPMHTALRLGLDAAARVRRENPDASLAFHGLYAPLAAELLLEAGAVAVLGGEREEELVAVAEALERGGDLTRHVQRGAPVPPRRRLEELVPSRSLLPSLSRYARFAPAGGEHRIAGYAEASRGCKHRCRHCPIPAVYHGRFFASPVEVVVEDVARQVAVGAEHVTFGDPDFLNGPAHALRVARAVHARFPALTFDFTAKVEHLVRRRAEVEELARLGAAFVTSAVESLDDRVLEKLAKGHTREEAFAAFEICRRAGLALRPTFVPFTPWETLDGYLGVLEELDERDWLPHVDPVQLTLRLLVPPGSLLEGDPSITFEGLDRAALGWRWRHPDPRMDALQRRVAAVAAEGAERREEPAETHARLREVALAVAGLPHRHVRVLAPDHRRVPRMTENWFC
jgi:radical SAM superfamily enzyme YgiQ (UPF0313 family)